MLSGELAASARSGSRSRVEVKSKSLRVVYYFYNDTMPVFLLTVFAKKEKDNLSKSERNALAEVARALRDSYGD